MAEKPLYQNEKALAPIEKVLNEASAAINDTDRKSATNSEIHEVLAAASGIGTGAGVGFAALYFGGVTGLSAPGITSGLAVAGSMVGGGMAAGIWVIAAPAVIFGVGAYAFISKRNKRKLNEKKEILLQSALEKQNKIISELKHKTGTNEERIKYLEQLNILLQSIIKDLENDLEHKVA